VVINGGDGGNTSEVEETGTASSQWVITLATN
jgi:hypothetical protein